MILVAGGAGFIGSHTAAELIKKGYEVLIADNFCNSDRSVIDSLRRITNTDVRFVDVDLTDAAACDEMFANNKIDSVILLAGYKAVGESVKKPLMYYRNNLDIAVTLMECMKKYRVKSVVFSSSATVYGSSNASPLTEDMSLGCANPYGRTKLMIEQMLADFTASEEISTVVLRYFNPVGAHESGLIGENPKGIPNNLMPFIAKVALGELERLSVFGKDYPTPDGTGVRDYIHVTDLAKGHAAAVEYAKKHKGIEYFNLGTGKGTSVLEMISAFEKASGKRIPYVFAPRRPGDIAECYADTEKAKRVLGWTAELSTDDMCSDLWKFCSRIKKS